MNLRQLLLGALSMLAATSLAATGALRSAAVNDDGKAFASVAPASVLEKSKFEIPWKTDLASVTTTAEATVTDTSAPEFDDFVENSVFDKRITITYNGETAVCQGEAEGVTVTVTGANVVVNSLTKGVEYELKGSSSQGSFKLYGTDKAKILLNGVTLTAQKGAAINIQSKKRVFIVVADGTENSLTDAAKYSTPAGEDEKGCIFSEGQLCFSGKGVLKVNGLKKHAIASDQYIRVIDGKIQAEAVAEKGSGFKVNDAFYMGGGYVQVSVKGNAAKAVSSDSLAVITGGELNAFTSGGVTYVAEEDDYSSCAALKADQDIIITGGTLGLQSSGVAGKGLSSGRNLTIGVKDSSAGPLIKVRTLGKRIPELKESNDIVGPSSSPKCIKAEGDIVINSGVIRVNGVGGDGAEGVESKGKTTIYNGDINCITIDDVLNANGGMYLHDGTLTGVSLTNDGIDVGFLYTYGGHMYIVGASGDQAGFDTDGKTFVNNGGTLAGVGGLLGGNPDYRSQNNSVCALIKGQYKYLSIRDDNDKDILVMEIPDNYEPNMKGVNYTAIMCSPLIQPDTHYRLIGAKSKSGGTEQGGIVTGATFPKPLLLYDFITTEKNPILQGGEEAFEEPDPEMGRDCGIWLNNVPAVADSTAMRMYFTLKKNQAYDLTAKLNYDAKRISKISVNGQTVANTGSLHIADWHKKGGYTMSVTDAKGQTQEWAMVFTNMPIVMLEQTQEFLYEVWKKNNDDTTPTNIKVIDANGRTYESTTVEQDGFEVEQDGPKQVSFFCNANVRVRGATSAGKDKKPFAVELCDENGEERNVHLLGYRSDGDWILDAMFNDRLRMRNRMLTDIWNSLQDLPYDKDNDYQRNGTDGEYVEVFLKGKYWGFYCFTDKIDRKKLNLKKTKDEGLSTEVTRGLLWKSLFNCSATTFSDYKENPKPGKLTWEETYKDITWEQKYPDDRPEQGDFTPIARMLDNLGLSVSVDKIDTILNKYFYVDNLIDYHIFTQAFQLQDNLQKNMYLSVRNVTKDSTLLITPWDLDASLGRNAGGDSMVESEKWFAFQEQLNGINHLFWKLGRLPKTSAYKQKFFKRWEELKNGALSVTALNKRMTEYADLFFNSGAYDREYELWKRKMDPDIYNEVKFATDFLKKNYAYFDAEMKEWGFEGGTTPEPEDPTDPTDPQPEDPTEPTQPDAPGYIADITLPYGVGYAVKVATLAGDTTYCMFSDEPQIVFANSEMTLSANNSQTWSWKVSDVDFWAFRYIDNPGGPTLLGDVNQDGKVDTADAICIVNYVIGKENFVFNSVVADYNQDGAVNTSDAIAIVNKVIGK